MGEAPEISEMSDMGALMRLWEESNSASTSTNPYDPVPVLTRMAEIVESELELFNKNDPDPFDERHPSRSYPSCNLGQTLKIIFKKDAFMDKLMNDYLRGNYMQRAGAGADRDSTELNIVACRLILDVLPGLEASAVFKTPDADSIVLRLFTWAEKAVDPLKSYAVGLLAAAMEIQDTAAVFRELNNKLVPLMLKWLWELQETMSQQRQLTNSQPSHRPFAHLNPDITPIKKKGIRRSSGSSPRRPPLSPPHPPLMSPPMADCAAPANPEPKLNGASNSNRLHRPYPDEEGDGASVLNMSDCSNSSWAEMESYVIASASIHPLTLAAKQMLILRYLTPMGEYQEYLGFVFELNALSLILNYLNIRETRETRLAFEGLKYLAALLCHKKVALEFINQGGLQKLLHVPRPSVAATGVSICFYYLAYCEDAMEKICMLPPYMITELVSYALWLLECSHNSGRCHATMFFGLSFQFRSILDEFDAQDGLRKMYNVMGTLPILQSDDEASLLLSDEEQLSYRQIVRHVMVALKRYFEAHLVIKHHFYTRMDRSSVTTQPAYKGHRSTPEEVQQQMETLMRTMPLHATWKSVDNLVALGGINLMLRIIAFSYDWNFSGRAETVQSALAVVHICSVRPIVQLMLCEKLKLPENHVSVGINIILGACEGEIVPDPEVQKTALQLLSTCVASPLDRVGSNVLMAKLADATSKRRVKSGEELMQRVWECVRENNGIIMLLMLMLVKTPLTDADEIRALACRCMAGLVRCEKVRQIVSKLPALTNGDMQVALRDPILQEKRAEHVHFQKYYLELITHIMGNDKHATHSQQQQMQDLSLTSIHRANVVAQTPITYNKTQLYQLIHQQLLQDGLAESAGALAREAALPPTKPPTPASPFPSSRLLTPGRISSKSHVNSCSRSNALTTPHTPSTTSPIKLTLNRKDNRGAITTTPNRSLQKQTSLDGWTVGVPSPKPLATPTTYAPPSDRVSLHSIVTEYLINQHALCKNPMVTCPQFNLFVPHRCPEPKARVDVPINFNMRFIKRQSGFRVSNSMDIRLSHSRFCPERTIRMDSDNGLFTCSKFIPNSSFLALGTSNGDIRLYNTYNGSEDAVYTCHESPLTNIGCNRAGNLVLTSSLWRRPISALWSFTTIFDNKISLDEEEYVEFSKTTQDKILGTNGITATIYDIETGKTTIKMTPSLSNNYTKNRATFNPTDELVLTDGVLYDVRTADEIYKFDKLNSLLSGVFHPNGLEIVSNTEVWDLRTFHLLRTVPALEKQHIRFNSAGTIIYTFSYEAEETEENGSYGSSFKTIDSRNYSSIATIDTKKEVSDLACNEYDTYLAVVENPPENQEMQETAVRIYEVGRRRDQEDDTGEEEDEDLSDESGSNSDDVEPNLLMQIMGLGPNQRNYDPNDDPDFEADMANDDLDRIDGGDEDDEDDDDADDDDDIDMASSPSNSTASFLSSLDGDNED